MEQEKWAEVEAKRKAKEMFGGTVWDEAEEEEEERAEQEAKRQASLANINPGEVRRTNLPDNISSITRYYITTCFTRNG